VESNPVTLRTFSRPTSSALDWRTRTLTVSFVGHGSPIGRSNRVFAESPSSGARSVFVARMSSILVILIDPYFFLLSRSLRGSARTS
jgi:hypothetical protein